nr:hypothetical protein [uncultured Desulfuromonas sp.]
MRTGLFLTFFIAVVLSFNPTVSFSETADEYVREFRSGNPHDVNVRGRTFKHASDAVVVLSCWLRDGFVYYRGGYHLFDEGRFEAGQHFYFIVMSTFKSGVSKDSLFGFSRSVPYFVDSNTIEWFGRFPVDSSVVDVFPGDYSIAPFSGARSFKFGSVFDFGG